MVYEKSMLRMQLRDYIKSMMLDFITKRINLFHFKLFKIVLMATINSIIVTALLLLNLYTVLLLKIYQIRKLDILIKYTIISRNIAFERVKRLKRRYLKAIQFFGSKTIHLRDDEPEDEPGSWLSQFVGVPFFF